MCAVRILWDVIETQDMPKKKEQKKNNSAKQYEDFDFSILTENFYNIDRKRFLDYKTLEQRLSSGYINYGRIRTEDEYFERAIRFLTRHGYGLFEYVTREKIAVLAFDSKTESSFCGLDQNKIQVGTNILTQTNIPRQTKVDLLMGITLHEEYHKKYTIRDIKESLHLKKYEEYYGNTKTTEFVKKLFPSKLHGILNNILEDKRIEKLGAEDLPGYSFFFDELRKYAVFLHSEKKFVPELPEAMLLDYILIKILIPELEDTFMDQIDLYEKELNAFLSQPNGTAIVESFKEDLVKVKDVIFKIKKHIENNNETIFSNLWKDILLETNNLYALFPKEMQEKLEKKMQESVIVYINITCELGGENLNQGERIELSDEQIQDLSEIMSDEIRKLEAEMAEDVKSSKSQQRIEEHKIIAKDANYNHYKTIQLIEEPLHPIDHKLYTDAKIAAKNICNNLGFLDSKFNRVIENFELTEGELDEDELYSIGYGNKHIFEECEDLPGYSLDFGILLDESGSMHSRIREAKLAVLSLLLGLKENKHINLFVYGHTANENGGDDTLQLYKYYNTLERFTDWRRIFSADSRSNNADGYAIEKVAEIMKTSKCRDKILCVVSDGQPAASGYGGKQGEAHVKSVTTRLENEGIVVIQICMAYIENSPRMFKHYIPYEKNGKFFDNLKKVLLGKLNQFADQV
jgi:hypothetical protein